MLGGAAAAAIGFAVSQVLFPDGLRSGPNAAWYKGLCFAESSDRAWIRDDGGFARVVDRAAVKALGDLGRGEHAIGAEVSAYSWVGGFRSGVIEEVLEPGLRYAVKLEDGATRAFFFEDLTADL